MTLLINNQGYTELVEAIGSVLNMHRQQLYRTVNKLLVQMYWEIGKRIVQFEQHGKLKAEYGTELLDSLSADLKLKFGKGFSRRNVLDMRRFYTIYPIWQTVSAELSWSHYVQLIAIENELARGFYEKQCIKEKWSVRELARQKEVALFERMALSKDKAAILRLAHCGQEIKNPADILKDPYVLEFLGLPEHQKTSEADLEQRIIDNLQLFLLELGKGFAFIKRQFRISFQ